MVCVSLHTQLISKTGSCVLASFKILSHCAEVLYSIVCIDPNVASGHRVPYLHGQIIHHIFKKCGGLNVSELPHVQKLWLSAMQWSTFM